ncbi:leucine-rich repeat domain-containing protein [Flavobacterium turcicum]|uniref:Leucine-rich repeat domain-containing protein n=1 Tax=Flavobacterium turcicum TaxID=2764718 RepID=A0ABR7JG15_9FLAO|nr:leucine-rich repeat domain-containing protein [Flavobacterium turcicum]MBC5863412.1 hypothetical protein [Flavobacterium turcicum]NHL02144.1 leucine-rich repeat domain-containing protein [Flavobacterium turcicum]
MEDVENTTDRYKLSEFYKGKEFEPTYVFVQQFDDKKLNSENIHIHSLSFLYDTLKTKGKLEIQKKWIDIFPKLDEVKRIKITFGINQELFDALSEIPNLEELIIDSSKITDLSQLTKIKKLKRFEIDSFTQLKDISILENIKLLQLRIENCFKIENYDIIGNIESLIGLALYGYIVGPKNLKIESLKIFKNLKKLKHLDLSFTSLIDKSSFNYLLEIDNLERFDYTGNIKFEIVEKIKKNHPKLKAGFFVDWDYKNNQIYEGKFW